MISVVLVSILLAFILLVYSVGAKTFYSQWTRSGIKGEAGRVLINAFKELRYASSVTDSQEESITFTADIDDDGADETIQYIWSGVAGEPLNRIAGTTLAVIGSVDDFDISYYDSDNDLLSFPVTPSSVKAVSLEVTVGEGDETFKLRSKADLRGL